MLFVEATWANFRLATILKLTRHWIFALLSVASILNLPT